MEGLKILQTLSTNPEGYKQISETRGDVTYTLSMHSIRTHLFNAPSHTRSQCIISLTLVMHPLSHLRNAPYSYTIVVHPIHTPFQSPSLTHPFPHTFSHTILPTSSYTPFSTPFHPPSHTPSHTHPPSHPPSHTCLLPGGWQSICQGTNLGNALFHELEGE